MKAKFVKAKKVAELKRDIESNLDIYKNGSFKYLTLDSNYFFDSGLEIKDQLLSKINVDENNPREVENCKFMYEALSGASGYMARDERLWVYLTHSALLEYTRTRWPIPNDDEKATKHILTHFFCNGARGFERDNAASRLWWLAHICSRVNKVNDMTMDKALECLLYKPDIRANIIERPTLSQSPKVFSGVIETLYKSYKGDKKLFEREAFRSFMKNLNLEGGLILLSALPNSEIKKILSRCVTI